MNNDHFPRKIIHFYHRRPTPKWKEGSAVLCTVFFIFDSNLSNLKEHVDANVTKVFARGYCLQNWNFVPVSFLKILNGFFANRLHALVIIFTEYVGPIIFTENVNPGRIWSSNSVSAQWNVLLGPGTHNWCSVRVVFYALHVPRVTKSHVREDSCIRICSTGCPQKHANIFHLIHWTIINLCLISIIQKTDIRDSF